MGVEPARAGDVAAFRARHGLEGPYVLYAGRIDAGKGCAAMLDHHALYRHGRSGAADLVLLGRLAMPEPRQDGVRYLGYVSEEDKATAMAGAVAVVCPSAYESLSIVLLEGLALGTPGLVNAGSAVLKEHCLRSNAGLFYSDADEYAEALSLLVRERGLREALGTNGRRYVDAEYRWSVVLDRWRALIAAVAR
jgi:glycosyltransferase involved in cell wall biosynthesis